jgi:hypothetical protein
MHPAKGDLPKKTAPEGCGGVLDFKKQGFYIMRLGAIW